MDLKPDTDLTVFITREGGEFVTDSRAGRCGLAGLERRNHPLRCAHVAAQGHRRGQGETGKRSPITGQLAAYPVIQGIALGSKRTAQFPLFGSVPAFPCVPRHRSFAGLSSRAG